MHFVELVDRDQPVLVTIRRTALEAGNQVMGEERVVGLARDLVSLPRVLGRIGGGENHTSAAGASNAVAVPTLAAPTPFAP